MLKITIKEIKEDLNVFFPWIPYEMQCVKIASLPKIFLSDMEKEKIKVIKEKMFCWQTELQYIKPSEPKRYYH